MTAVDVPQLVSRRLPLALSPDDRELQSAVRRFLSSVVPEPTADRPGWAAIDPDRRLWRRLAGEVGVQSLSVPEEQGGQGFGLAELGIVFEELGRTLCAAPLLGTVALASRALVAADASPTRDDLLGRIAGGEVYAAAWLDGTDGPPAVTAAQRGEHVVLRGTITPVVDGDLADVLVVTATGPEGPGLYAVGLTDAGVTRTAMTTLDLTRGAAVVTLDGVPATVLMTGAGTERVANRVEAEARTLLAAESVGAARAALDLAVAYAKIRTQFGQPIGSFQALKHRMADMLAAVESAWAATRHAAAVADHDDDELELASRIAKAAASETLSFVAAENIQIHGGIGFTWEHTAHLYYRRARTSAVLLGLPSVHRDRIAALLTRPAPALSL